MHTSSPTRRHALFSLALGLFGCGAPDPDQTGFVLLDEEARAAGLAVETDGERHAGTLPIAVDPGQTAIVSGPGHREEIQIGPQEVVEIRGADGEIVRDHASDRLVVRGSEAGATVLAEMLDTPLHRLRDGRFELRGDHVLLVASMLDGIPDLVSTSAVAPADFIFGDPTGEVTAGMPRVAMDAPVLEETDEASAGPDLEAAAVVGVYRAARVTMIFDAAGGYRTLVGDDEVQRGRWNVLGRSVVLHAVGGSEPVRLGVTDHSVIDASGAEFAAGGAL